MDKKIKIKGFGEWTDIIIYTLPECIMCNSLKGILNESNIIYTEIDVSLNEDIGYQIQRKYITKQYPIIELISKSNHLTILMKTNLESQEGIIILDNIYQITKYI